MGGGLISLISLYQTQHQVKRLQNAKASEIGTKFFVSPLGDDGQLGTHTSPFKTIKQCHDKAQSGDSCIVSTGVYNEHITLSKSLVLRADGKVEVQSITINADDVTIDGFDISNTLKTDPGGIIIKKNNCTVINNYIHNTAREGISSSISSSNCLIQNNRIYQAQMAGVTIDGTNHMIEDNEVWGTLQFGPLTPPDTTGKNCKNPKTGESARCGSDADGMRFFGTGHVFKGNTIHDIKFDAIMNITAHTDCFQTWTSNTANITFDGNICDEMYAHIDVITNNKSVAQGFMIEGNAHDITIKNNLFHVYRGINIGDSDNGPGVNITITNNTFIGQVPRLTVSLGTVTQTPAEYGVFVTAGNNIIAKNNIFYNIDGEVYVGSISGGYNFNYRTDTQKLAGCPKMNDYWGDGKIYSSCSNNLGKVAFDPKFVNPFGAVTFANFSLQTISPLLGSGENGVDIGIPFVVPTTSTSTLAMLTTTPVPTITPTPTILPTPTSPPVELSPTMTPTSTPPPTPTVTPTLIPTLPIPTSTPVYLLPTRRPKPTNNQPPKRLRSKITVYAAGTASDDVYPTMQLLIDDQIVYTWKNINGNALLRQTKKYTYQSRSTITEKNKITITFINDGHDKRTDRNLFIDKIEIDDFSKETESQSTYSIGSWGKTSGCSGGYKKSEWLHCNGSFTY